MQQLDLKQIGLWVLIWLVGYGLGLFESWAKEKLRKEEKEEPQVTQTPPQLIEENYALAIFEEGNDLVLKMDGNRLEDPSQLDEGQRKRLINLIVRLRPWLDGGKTTLQKAPPKPQPKPAVSQPAQPAPRPIAPPAPPPTISPKPTPASAKIESQPIVIEKTAEDMEYAKLSMVEQIDWILQKNLEKHPLKAKRIRLKGALTGGVSFLIGDEHYEFIDEIPYPDIKEVIQQAISEWEDKSTPGL
jgi:hypothetical protein